MKTDEIRTRFLEFFRERGHRVVTSGNLVPSGDPTLLFTGAGMNQFKDEFYGRGDRTLKRAVTCQKCVRTGDIEKVGKTASHHTFFEMLGNFSFGDYFKRESIEWAWEFMTEEMGVPAGKMAVSIYHGDEESYEVWRRVIGVPEERIFQFDEGENFWPPNARTQGPNGPCGPCSEIFWDVGEGCGRPDCNPSCDCGRYVEVWNLVFQQYDRQEDATLAPLPMRNIDTGMGLERMARLLQGVETNFDIDVFRPLIRAIQDVCKPDGDDPSAVQCVRRIADHARALTFCIADGVIPSNEERGYVVRRLLRRAVRDAYKLGAEDPFIVRLVEPICGAFGDAYPELRDARAHIETVIGEEEKAFQKTVKRGSALLAQQVARLKQRRGTVLRGGEVFDLYQTYGFPIEMTESILAEEGFRVDMQGFLHEMKAHQELSKQSGEFTGAIFAGGPIALLQERHEPTEFTGYRTLESAATVIGIIRGEELVESAGEGDEAAVVLDRTPAYADSGGQVGDRGCIVVDGDEGARFRFDAVRKEKDFHLHVGRMIKGSLRTGTTVTCHVNKETRMATARNHTATHVLHYALREVLGRHAKQAGSHVSPERLRFDFANPRELTPEQIRRIEDIANDRILEDQPVTTTRMSLSEAREAGAIALFGETYGDIVRVVSTGDFSRELCGGTHCERTGQIGLFRITREMSVASGVRRIEAVTGTGALMRSRERDEQIARLCATLGTQEQKLVRRAEEVLQEIRSLQKQLQQARHHAARRAASGGLAEQAEQIGDVRVVLATMDVGPDELRSAADVLRKANKGVICLLASVSGGKVALVAGVSDDCVERGFSARELACEAAAVLGGGGGGRDDLAQAGGRDASRLEEAFERVRRIVRETTGG